ncbi:hypothetical protein E8E13_010716 [Curvularia kusanoi]|uniref:Uncharacterized protein n=1 Tax=Curvularia kusanoi TaxID=90978 RepID=A0A9P4TNB0_CURKU|nr:hypothetical protein E8E13_010716 [Curvularia kusanoi]
MPKLQHPARDSRQRVKEEKFYHINTPEQTGADKGAGEVASDEFHHVSMRREKSNVKIKDKIRNLNARVMKRARKAIHLEQMAMHKKNLKIERPANKLHRLGSLLSCMTRAASVDDPTPNSIARASTEDSTEKKLSRSTIIHQPHLQSRSRSTPKKAIPELGSQRTPSSDDSRLSISEAGQNTRLARLATVIAKHCSGYRLEEDAEDICKQLKLYTQVYSTRSAEPLSPRNTSISARLAMFYPSTLVPMDLVLKFPPALYTSIIADNARRASLDMVELNQIWSEFIGPAPGSWRILLSSRMQLLSESEVEKLCKLATESLYCWAYWTLSIKMRGTGKEGAMNDDRWRDYVAKLAYTNHFDASAIAKQLIVVGWKYIDISDLRSTIDMVKVLEMSMSPVRGFKSNIAKTAVREGKVNVSCQTSMSTATVPEEMAGSMVRHNKASPKATIGSEPDVSVHQRPIGPGTYHIENDDADKIGKEPLQSSCSSQEDSTPEGENKESPKAEEKALKPAHSSLDILREINDD